ncbi:MAG: hypothetical protein WBH85_10945 [Thermoanaerobaculia bacterium]
MPVSSGKTEGPYLTHFLPSSGRWATWVAASLLLVSHLGLLWTFELSSHLLRTFLWLALAFLGLLVADRLLAARSSSVAAILLAAACLRLILLPLPATLSDDIYRYVWDGRVAGAGLNPYFLAPDSPELDDLRDDLWERLPHRQVATVYPPLAMAIFSIAARLPAPTLALKLILSLIDLGSCALLLLLIRRLGVPEHRAIWYAWNPLVTLEIAGMGHVDALGVAALLVVAVALMSRPPRAVLAGVAAAAAVVAKLVPLVGLPAWARQSGRPWVFVAVAAGLLVVSLVPIVVLTGGVPSGLVAYGVRWEFNGPLFEPLWRLLDQIRAADGVSSLLDWAKTQTGWIGFWNRFYPWNYPQLLSKLILAAGLLVALGFAWTDRRPIPSMGKIFSCVILFSATVYPWYLVWILPWAAICRHTAWLGLSGLILLSYLPQFTEMPLFPWVYLLIWTPFFLLFLLPASRWSID